MIFFEIIVKHDCVFELKKRECIFYATMSKMSQMSKLKNHIKSERSKIFQNGQMRKVAQNLRNLRKNFQKIE